MQTRHFLTLVISTLLAASVMPAAARQALNFSTPKEAVFNVPLNFNNLPPMVVTKIKVLCSVYANANPPSNDSEQQLAGGATEVAPVNGTYNGVVKVSFSVSSSDANKVKSWRCRTMLSGPTFSEVNLTTATDYLPDSAKPAPGAAKVTHASGKYD